MLTNLVLGPALAVIEPEPAPVAPGPPPGRRWIEFDSPATLIGGFVRVRPTPAADPSDVPPLNIYAVYVQPHEAVPADATPEWFFAAHDGVSQPVGHVPFGDPSDDGVRIIHVLGVKPGAHLLQTILEYPA